MVPHATSELERRRSSSSQPPSKFKFPDYNDPIEFANDEGEDISRGPSPRPLPQGLPPGLHSSERWPTRRDSTAKSWASWASNGRLRENRPGRQKSLSEAIRTVRTRKASISENAQEIAQSLKAPVSFRLVVCSHSFSKSTTLANINQAALRNLVRHFNSHEHFFQGHLDRTTETCHTDHNPIPPRFILVRLPLSAS